MLLLREQILNVLTTKKWKLCDMMEELVKVVVVTTLQYTCVSNSVHFKLTSIISQYSLGGWIEAVTLSKKYDA